MRLQELVLENYRGFNKKSTIPLDGRVLLFYGQNGRGKSSVFGALEMALFPAEKIGELRRDYGTRAPLTNRFNTSPLGTIQLRVEEEAEATIHQEVRDQLDDMQPEALPLHRRIAGHRRRIFFTQDLLRDLMLGSPSIRYQRLNELLGCDAYDRLLTALNRWAEMRGPRLQYQMDAQKRMERISDDISATLRKSGMDSIWNGLAQRRFAPDAVEWVERAVLRFWRGQEEELFTFVTERAGVDRAPTGRAIATIQQVLAKLMQALTTLSTTELVPDVHFFEHALPAKWSAELQAVSATRLEAQALHLPSLEARIALTQHLLRKEDASPEVLAQRAQLAVLEQERREVAFRIEEAQHAWTVLVESFRKRTEALMEQAEAGDYVLSGLRYLQSRARRTVEQMPTTMKQATNLVRHRRNWLYGVRYLYDTLIQLTHAELQRRAGLLRPRWREFYGQISAHSHFQRLDMDIEQELPEEDAMTGMWSSPSPRRTVRFLVSDRDDKKGGDAMPMQAILSEGQLNCAVVGLALALSRVTPPPLKVIALDDPFVSWDDVNMENFLAAVRTLAWKDWTVILSTCDLRVASSFRKNMETLGPDFQSITYTFHDWDKERGPRIAIERLPYRESRWLRDLPPDVFERELL